MYNPEEIKDTYDKIEHGKARVSAIRAAAAEADQHGDVPYQMFFRADLCHESCFYGDGMDMMVVFPELLALSDKHPDAPTTVFDEYVYADALDHVLWIYKWVLSHCESFYQIPMEDCLKFFEDCKARFLAYGYNLRPWHLIRYDFYQHIDRAEAEASFHEFEKLPRDLNSDCEACERNTEILFYLEKGDLKKAKALARDIENFKLTCGEKMAAWLRLKKHYMHYYMKRKEFDKALEYCRMMERNLLEESEYERWDDFLACYAYSDIGKALKIYKEHWKDWLNWRDPSDEFHFSINVCRFFRELEKDRGNMGAGSLEAADRKTGNGESAEPTIRLSFDSSFPLYEESGQYSIRRLYDFYYGRAEELAAKFDARNGTDSYRKELEEALCTTRQV